MPERKRHFHEQIVFIVSKGTQFVLRSFNHGRFWGNSFASEEMATGFVKERPELILVPKPTIDIEKDFNILKVVDVPRSSLSKLTVHILVNCFTAFPDRNHVMNENLVDIDGALEAFESRDHDELTALSKEHYAQVLSDTVALKELLEREDAGYVRFIKE